MTSEKINDKELQEKRIHVSRRYYMTISALIAILIWAIGATAYLFDLIKLDPIKIKVQHLKQESSELSLQNNSLSKELTSLKEAYHELLGKIDIPVLLTPTEGANVIGKQITFKWDYESHNEFQKYIIELRNISDKEGSLRKFNVLNPEQKLMHFPSARLQEGEYLWRIVPGNISESKEVVQGPPSDYHYFSFYETVFDRIVSTKRLRVGTSPTLIGKFNFINDKNEFKGFDIDLVKWVARELSEQLRSKQLGMNGELQVDIIDTPWDKLLCRLKSYELDLVISSMTSTKGREERYRGVKFTKGYFQTKQILIQTKKDGKFPEDLDGKTVGVSSNTTNEQVAGFLKNKYKFKVDNSYKSYSDLFEALYCKKVDFALVDDILVADHIGDRFFKFGNDLSKILEPFYKKNFGRESEMYAMAVIDERPNNNNILELIDSLILSDKGQSKLAELKNKERFY